MLEMDIDIWNISISTPPYPTLHLDKIVLQLLSLLLASAPPRTLQIIFHAERKYDIFSFTVAGEKIKSEG